MSTNFERLLWVVADYDNFCNAEPVVGYGADLYEELNMEELELVSAAAHILLHQPTTNE